MLFCFIFFFNDPAATEIYTLSLHDALPILRRRVTGRIGHLLYNQVAKFCVGVRADGGDRKSTRLNSSHGYISYAVFCLKKKKKNTYSCDPASPIDLSSNPC